MNSTPTKTLTWSEAVDKAMVPTELDHAMINSFLPNIKHEIDEDGKLTQTQLIRERATRLYLEAHEGEEAEVTYTDPLFADNRDRLISRVKGTLERNYVQVPRFHNNNHLRTVLDGFVIDGMLVPFTGVSSIRVEGDTSVVIL